MLICPIMSSTRLMTIIWDPRVSTVVTPQLSITSSSLVKKSFWKSLMPYPYPCGIDGKATKRISHTVVPLLEENSVCSTRGKCSHCKNVKTERITAQGNHGVHSEILYEMFNVQMGIRWLKSPHVVFPQARQETEYRIAQCFNPIFSNEICACQMCMWNHLVSSLCPTLSTPLQELCKFTALKGK